MQEDDPPAFVVIGEALIDLATPDEDGSAVARPGGSPMNVAIGLARLGERTGYVPGSKCPDPEEPRIRQCHPSVTLVSGDLVDVQNSIIK